MRNCRYSVDRGHRSWLRLITLLTAGLAPLSGFTQDSEDASEIDEVVVSGQKIERSLQDTVTSVAVFDEATIEEQNFITLGDILNQTANVSTAFNEGIITIRGVRNTGAGVGDNTSNVSAVYVDGVFLAPGLFTSGALNLWDIESAEIFRGPQSTVQGRNALAGAVVLNTVDPSDELEGAVQLQYGEFNSQRLSGAVSLPVSDTFGIRLAVDDTSTDGWITNPTLNTDESDRREATTFRAKALWTPASVDGLSLSLNYTNIDSVTGDGRVLESVYPSQRITRENLQTRIGNEGDIASLIIDYELSDVWTLTSVTAYTDSALDSFIDTTRDETGGASASQFNSNDKITSQELRASFQTERFRGLFGLFLYNQQRDTAQDATSIVGTDLALPDPFTIAQLFFMTPTPSELQIAQAAAIRQATVGLQPSFPVDFDRTSDLEIDNRAIFGEIEYFLDDRWTLTFGLRYDQEDIRQNIFDSTFVPPITTGDALVDQVLGVLATQFTNVVDIPDVDNDFDAWLPKFSANYAWTENVSTAFTYQRGYRAGGLSINQFRGALAPPDADQATLEAAGVVNSYDPEFTNNYEFAFRSQSEDGRLTINSNIFYIDYTDQQVGVQLTSNPLDVLTVNIGESELFGFEVDVSYLAADGLLIGGNLGFVETEFTEGRGVLDEVVGGGRDLTGLEFAYAPKVTGGLFARYEWENGWFLNGRYRYSDESFALPENFANAVNESFSVFDFLAGYQAETWRAELYLNNALDEEYFTANLGPQSSSAFNVIGQPRTFGGRVIMRF
ncbi:MAG: TonB-dependent receptor [Pseudomonadota bacterium]